MSAIVETDNNEAIDRIPYLEAELQRTEARSRIWARIGGTVTAANITLDVYTIEGMLSGYDVTDTGYFLVASSAVIAFASIVSSMLQDTHARYVQEELEVLYDKEMVVASSYQPTAALLEPFDPNPNYDW